MITDSARAPFVKADEIWAKYSLGTLRGKKLEFNDVKLVRPIIVIDKQPGGKWNYDRIFPRDTMTRTGVKKTGWGTWIRFSNVTVVDGDLTIRSPWDPARMTPAERADKVRAALGPEWQTEDSAGRQRLSEGVELSSHQRIVSARAAGGSRVQEPDDRCRRAEDDRASRSARLWPTCED